MTTSTSSDGAPALTKKDFESNQEIRWCPGCGDYAILKAVQTVLPKLEIPRERFVFVSGIGCASRFPYYMNTYGFHTIHGRAFPIATGIKLANPDLSVWVIAGDGDALSIGGNHFIHAMRRNLDINVLLFNNRIYGLTKGQTSPTSEMGKRTKSTPLGNPQAPFDPVALALGARATFVARSVDIYGKHLQETLRRAAEHKGCSFVEIYQNCNIFNDGAFHGMTSKDIRDDRQVELRQGEPLIFGKNRDKGIRVGADLRPEVITLGPDVDPSTLAVHDETGASPVWPYVISQLHENPDFPTPIGIFRAVEAPSFEETVTRQIHDAVKAKGDGNLAELLLAGDPWQVD